MIRVEVDATAAQAAIERAEQGARAVGAIRLGVGSDLVYAYGIEEGRHRGGRLARRAGGAHMIRRGLQEGGPRIAAYLGDAVPYGAGAVNTALARGVRIELIPAVRRLTPVRSGRLRRSMDARQG